MIALGAGEIIMDKHSFLGKIDPLFTHDKYLQLAIIEKDQSKKYKKEFSKYLINTIEDLVNLTAYSPEIKDKIKQELIYSEYVHDKSFDYNDCVRIGLNVRRPRDNELELFK